MTWDNAKEYCKARNSRLVSINSEEEHRFIRSMLKNESSYRAWTGGIKKYDSGEYIWDNGSLFDFTFWDNDQPNDDKDANKPVGIYLHPLYDFNWCDYYLTSLYYVICKI